MSVNAPVAEIRRRATGLGVADLAVATYDERGVFTAGRRAELDALRAMGSRDPSLGRIFEGHLNGALLVALYGSDVQRERARADVARGALFGVWNTQDDDPLTIERDGTAFVLRGAKTWASAGDSVARALVTARNSDGGVQMCLVPLDRTRTAVDPAAWRPLGMHDSRSYRVDFSGVVLEADDLIGAPGDYERAPWFLGGAIRFAAVHVGIVERIVADVSAYVLARGREADPFARARVAEMRIAAHAGVAWLRLAEAAWTAYDAEPSPARAAEATDASDMARTAIERGALDTLERAIRTVGAHGMVEPLPFAGLFRDLQMYLRQPAPDAALMRVADRAFAMATAARSVATASSTGSSGSASNQAPAASTRASDSPKGANGSTSSPSVAASTP